MNIQPTPDPAGRHQQHLDAAAGVLPGPVPALGLPGRARAAWPTLLGGMMAAAATRWARCPCCSPRPATEVQDSLYGFGAGVMLAASAFSLVAPGIAAAASWGMAPGAPASGGAAILLGAAVLLLMDRCLPHEHFIKGREGIEAHRLRRTWLFVFAITLHNLPEGLAIGVGYAGNDPLRGTALATGIAIQDIPEGLVVAVALMAAGYKRAFAWRWACCRAWSSRWARCWALPWWAGRRPCCRGDWALPPGPCCSSSAMKSFPNRTARDTRSMPPAG